MTLNGAELFVEKQSVPLERSTSLHTWLATDAILAEGEISQEAVNKGKFLK